MDDLGRALGRYLKVVGGSERARYLIAKERGELEGKRKEADELVGRCGFCERDCFVDRKEGKLGHCGVGYESRVAAAFVHMGEEEVLVPSGAIFFSGCNLHCRFCQNWDISQFPQAGEIWKPEKIARWIESTGAININLVGGEPTPNLHNIISALCGCRRNIAVVWNSNMYMSEQAMELLGGIVDVYLADFKYGNGKCAERLSKAPRYFEVVSRNHLLAKKHAELLIRHLVLPSHVECCSKKILEWIAENLGQEARVNLMSQYRPGYKAGEHGEINRRLKSEEYREAVKYAERLGLNYETQAMPRNFFF